LDLYALVGYTLACTAAVLQVGGSYAALLLVLLVPGYAVTAVAFPGKEKIDWIERLVLSFGLSIATVVLLGLGLNFTPIGIQSTPVVATVALFTLVLSSIAYRRRIQLQPEERLSLSVNLAWPAWRYGNISDRLVVVALAASIALAIASIAHIAMSPRPEQSFTEFYLLGPNNTTSGYPTQLNVSQAGNVILGIVNHEIASVDYTVRIDLVGTRIVYNTTSGFNETIDVNRTTWSIFNVTLADGREWSQSYTFQINATGFWKLQFLLYKNDDFSTAYQELRLFIRVS